MFVHIKFNDSSMSILTDNSIQALNDRLPSGWLNEARDRLNGEYGRSQISMVKNGKSFNEDIINVLFQLAEEEDARRADLNLVAQGKKKLADLEVNGSEPSSSLEEQQTTGQKG